MLIFKNLQSFIIFYVLPLSGFSYIIIYCSLHEMYKYIEINNPLSPSLRENILIQIICHISLNCNSKCNKPFE